MSFSFIFYGPDLVRKLLPKMTSYLAQDKSFLLIDICMNGIFSFAVAVVAMADKAAAVIALRWLFSESDASF